MTAEVAATGVLLRERTTISESAFREIYDSTARPLKGYLTRVTGNAALADDLLQETYFRYLRSSPDIEPAQIKSYLYRVATNLAHDHFRRRKFEGAPAAAELAAAPHEDLSRDLDKLLGEIEPREGALIWLAYVEGASHREIASITGLKEASIRPLLFRIRHRLAGLLRRKGLGR